MSRQNGVKMNLAEFAGPAGGNDLPSAPSESGAYSAPRGYGHGGGGGYDREDRPRRRYDDEAGEEEGPSRADEADRWRRSAPVSDSRGRDEMPGRADSEDRWRPRQAREGGFGDRDGGFGGRDGGRFGGDRDGGRFGGDRFGGDREERPRYGGYGGDRFGDRDSGRDDRPAHLRFGGARRTGDDAPAPASSRFNRPAEEREDREERGSDRPSEGAYRPRDRFGDRDGGDRFGGDRFGGDREDRPRYGGYGGDRFGDRDGGRFDRGGDRFGDRDGGSRFGGSDRWGDRPTSRYGGYGASRGGAPSYDEPLPTAPLAVRMQQDDAPQRRPLKLKKSAAQLAAKPVSMEERQVAVDESLLQTAVVSLAEKLTPLEAAVEDNQTISEAQLVESMQRLKLDKEKEKGVDAYAAVLAKSLVDGKVGLPALAQIAPQLLLDTLTAFKNLKGDKALLELIAAGQAKDAQLNVLNQIAGGRTGKDLDSFLESAGLLVLKPIPDLSEDVAAALAAGQEPQAVLQSINEKVDAKLNPGVKVAGVVAAHLFEQVFKADPAKPDTAMLAPWSALLARVAPSSDQDAQVRVLFEAQGAWFRAGAAKGGIKALFQALHDGKHVRAESFDAWRNDTKEKMKNGKTKALLQVHAWITEIQPKVHVSEHEDSEDDIDEQLDAEYGD